MIFVAGAVFASFASPTKFSAGSPADAADAIPPPVARDVKVPEFVPVINFSQFVLAMQTFAAENPPAARLAAEALSAKFTSDQTSVQTAQRTAPIIITRPVTVAPVTVANVQAEPIAQSEPALPSAPDPTARPSKEAADPVKVAIQAARQPAATHHKQKMAKARPRSERRFQPAMGLGMTIESAENAPPISSLAQKKRPATGE